MIRANTLRLAIYLLFLSLLYGCAEFVKVGATIGQQTGHLSREDSEALSRLAQQTAQAVRPMTEQEEFYLGRAVAATILGKYRLLSNERLTRYVNEVGQAIALASARPFTYGGYHFAILDTEEANALACPGGIVFLTRGMLIKAQNEEELAAILAHEVSHVSQKDGVASIQKSRWAQVVTTLGSEAARKYGGAEMAKLVSLFEGSVNDVVSTLLVRGYSREQERAADFSALKILRRLGYNSYALPDYLEKLASEEAKGAARGIFTTHPGMKDRVNKARLVIAENQWPRVNHLRRDQRFQDSLG